MQIDPFQPSPRGISFVQAVNQSTTRLALIVTVAFASVFAGAQVAPSHAAAAPQKESAIPNMQKERLSHKPGSAETKNLLHMRAEHTKGFIENKGQWPADVKFMGRSDGLDLWVTKEGLRLDSYVKSDAMVNGHVVGIKFLGGQTLSPKGSQELGSRTDFLDNGRDARGARTFETVQSQSVYPGITLKNYFDAGRPRYDFLVRAHEDPSRIRMQFIAANGLSVEPQKLSVKTSVGTLVQSKLAAYQIVDGKKKTISVAFRKVGKDTVGFKLGKYDHSKQLVIDPLIYGSYYGGDSGMDEVHAVVSDLLGGVYMTGSTKAPDFPAIFGPYSFTLSGARDAFISKLEGDVYRHDYAVFLGGNNEDSGEFLQLDQFGDLWVSGYTNSPNFPGRTAQNPGAFGPTPNVQYLDYDLLASQGHTASGATASTISLPQSGARFRMRLPGIGGGTWSAYMPFNASTSVVQSTLQTYLNSFLPGQTVQVVDTGSGAIDAGRGYKLIFSSGVVGDFEVDSTFLQAHYQTNPESVTNRAQVMFFHSLFQGDQPPSKGAYVLHVPYTRNGSFTATTSPLLFNAPAGAVQAAMGNMQADPSDPNQSPVAVTVEVQPADQALTGTLPGTAYILFFPTAPLLATTSEPRGINEIQKINITGATGGTFTLTPPGLTTTTSAIAWNATAADVQAAIDADYGTSSCLVTQVGQVYTVEFINQQGQQNLAQMAGQFGALIGGTPSITTVRDGVVPMDNVYTIAPTTVTNVLWNTQSSFPTGPDNSYPPAEPIPDPNGGMFNINVGGTFTANGGRYNSSAQQLHDELGASALIGGGNIVVLPNDLSPDVLDPKLPTVSLAVIFVEQEGPFGTKPVPNITIQNNQIINGSVFGAAIPTMVAHCRVSPTPIYEVHSEYKCFVMRFKQDPNTFLNPLPTKAFFFGGEVAPVLCGFRIIPHDNPVAGEPIRMAFGGTVFDPSEFVPEITKPVREGQFFNPVGFILRVNYTDTSGFSVDPNASEYIDAYDSSSNLGIPIILGGIDVDANANVYAGGTIRGNFGDTIDTSVQTTIFPTTAVDSTGTNRDGRLLRYWDGFVRKYSSSGSITYSVFVGGDGADEGMGVAVDANGDAYLVGRSRSFNYPRTRGVFGETFTQSLVSTVAKLNPSATDLIYCTHLRTANTVTPIGIAVDSRGIAYVTLTISRGTIFNQWSPSNDPNMNTGYEFAGQIPTTGDALSGAYNEVGAPDYGGIDGALVVLNPSATNILFGSYFGGNLDDQIYRPFVDKGGDVWICGYTDTWRAYLRPAKWRRAITRERTQARLPATMLTNLAFRPTPDPNNGLGGPGSQFVTWQLYNTEGDFDPVYLQTWRDRDGFVDRLRVNGVADITSVAFNPATIPGGLGASSTGVVNLSQGAPAGGAVVTLTMSASAPASFDSSASVTTTSITIPAGATQGTFTVFSQPVSDNVPVDVTATYQGNFHVGRVVIVPWLQSFTVTPQEVVGGGTVSGRIQLSGVAGSQGVTVQVTSNNPSVVSVQNVTVPANQNAVAFNISTNGVDTDTTVTLNASLLGVGKTFQLIVHPAQLKALTLSPNPVSSGTPTTGTVVLNGKPGGTGFDVDLSIVGSPAGYSLTPTKLHFGPGVTLQTFQMTTPYEQATVNQTVTATMEPSAGYTPNSVSGTVSVVADAVTGLTLTPNPVNGGQTSVGQVTLATAALAGGANVDISVSPSNGIVTAPTKVNVPEGKTFATFNINTTTTIAEQVFAITASRGASAITANLDVKALTFTVTVPSLIASGSQNTGTITLSGPAAAGGIAVHLSDDNPTVLPIPNIVTIPAGATSVNFPVNPTTVSSDTLVTISATIGTVTHTATTTVHASKLVTLTLMPNYVLNLQTVRCTLTLDGPAPSGGLPIILTSTDASVASVPASVTVPAGQSTLVFSIVTRRVTRTLQTTITGISSNGGQASAVLTVHN